MCLLGSVLGDDDADLGSLMAQTKDATPASIHRDLTAVLVAHAAEFEKGNLPLERLLGVIFSPFLMLLAKEKSFSATADASTRSAFLDQPNITQEGNILFKH